MNLWIWLRKTNCDNN